ncbi:Hpt domain-containing protein [Pararhodobacter sp.]|uniref:Hpt domain-containing protein n=1 Tax=Pararhodobacter sp. TaxID=2127056 RepID=UPI002B003040|nr:Hpt domain-containing protein [Pararhodobacter sp.]
MIDTSSSNQTPNAASGAIDLAVLYALLNIGGAEMRDELCATLIADFDRLQAEVAANQGPALARSAHELKGLSATVGAKRLADMARALDAVAATLPDAARVVMVSALDREMTVVRAALNAAALGTSSE